MPDENAERPVEECDCVASRGYPLASCRYCAGKGYTPVPDENGGRMATRAVPTLIHDGQAWVEAGHYDAKATEAGRLQRAVDGAYEVICEMSHSDRDALRCAIEILERHVSPTESPP